VWTFSNVTAGSDTVAVVMRSCLHGILSDAESLDRLLEELAPLQDTPSSVGSWKDISSLPFLDACVNEGLRLYPAFGLPLERVVPASGSLVCGKFLPEGTVVGMNPWVVNRHKPTFGEDAEQWNPSRWLCSVERRHVMDKSLLSVSKRADAPLQQSCAKLGPVYSSALGGERASGATLHSLRPRSSLQRLY
jgi:cytochrome P450